MKQTEQEEHVENVEDEEKGAVRVDHDFDKSVNLDRIDDEVLKYTNAERIEIDEATNKRILGLINRRILPLIVLTYLVQGLDKATISMTAIMGIREETNLVGQEYSWLTTIVYLAILVSEFPTNWLIPRVPIAKYLSFCICGWGVALACQAACQNFAGLMVCRFLLGMFETVCQPAFLMISSQYWLRKEQAIMISIWFAQNGVNSIIGGVLSYSFSLINSDAVAISNWRILFLVYGCCTVVFGLVVAWIMPDSPMRAKCWSEEDKMLIVERVRENQTGVQNKVFRWEQIREAAKDPQCYVYPLIQFCVCAPGGGLGAFGNIIINSLGFSVLQTQLLSMCGGAWIVIVLFTSSYMNSKLPNSTFYIMMAFPLISIACTVIMMTVPVEDTLSRQAGLLVAYYLCMSFWATQTLGMSLVPRNIAGQTKKAFTTALVFVGWCGGNAVGAQLFLDNDAPRYVKAFAVHLALYILAIILSFGLRIYLSRQNKIKQKKIDSGEEVADVYLTHAFEDLTDRQNVNFRYNI